MEETEVLTETEQMTRKLFGSQENANQAIQEAIQEFNKTK